MFKGTLVLEGGAARGVFTAGILDYFMEKDFYLSEVIGVSAGACNAAGYLSRQMGRTRDCMIHKDRKTGYHYSLPGMIRRREFCDMEKVFDIYPNSLYPFDYQTYFSSEINCEIVVTNCLTGKAEYLNESEDGDQLMKIFRASSSMALLAPIVNIEGVPYLDGGIADPIPVKRGTTKDNDKIVIIQTRNPGYRKKPVSRGVGKLYRRAYKSYPNLVKSLLYRNRVYNRTMEMVETMEAGSEIFVMRPLIPAISRMEKNYDTLMNFYEHGYNLAKKEFDNLQRYIDR